MNLDNRLTAWDVIGVALGVGFPFTVVIAMFLRWRVADGTVVFFSMALLIWAAITLVGQQREDNRHLEQSRLEANRLIEEYESIHGAGSSPWPRFQ